MGWPPHPRHAAGTPTELLGFAGRFYRSRPTREESLFKTSDIFKKNSPFPILSLSTPLILPLPFLGSVYAVIKHTEGATDTAVGYGAFGCDELCRVLSPNAGAWLFAAVDKNSYTKYPPFVFRNTSRPLRCPERGLELEGGFAAGRNGLRQLAEVADAFETRV